MKLLGPSDRTGADVGRDGLLKRDENSLMPASFKEDKEKHWHRNLPLTSFPAHPEYLSAQVGRVCRTIIYTGCSVLWHRSISDDMMFIFLTVLTFLAGCDMSLATAILGKLAETLRVIGEVNSKYFLCKVADFGFQGNTTLS